MATMLDLIAAAEQRMGVALAERSAKQDNLIAMRSAVEAGDSAITDDQITAAIAERDAADAALKAAEANVATLRAEHAEDERITRMQNEFHPTASQRAGAEVNEPNPVYRRDDVEHSYFRDLFNASRGEDGARRRLVAAQETRAATTTAANGGTFAPPLWLVEDFVDLARAGRVTADLIGSETLPEGVSSVNLPKITQGSGVAVTVTQNTTITETTVTTTSVSSGISEITGKQTVSIALLRQSGTPLDRIILSDLAEAYAVMLDSQVLSGSGASGQLRGLVTAGTAVTYTTSAPAVVSATATNSFYMKVLSAQATLTGARYLPADAIVMHPRRWAWVLSALDTTNRPLVVPSGPAINQAGVSGSVQATGYAGEMLGLPVYVDPNVPTTIGAATNQDYVFVLRKSDLRLWESAVETASFDATYADQNSILYRVLGFAAFIPDRHQASVQVIGGTGLVAPSFA